MKFNSPNLVIILIVVIGILFLLFLLIRSIVLWYYKIDYRVKQNDELIRLLKEIRDKISSNDSFDDFLNQNSKKNKIKHIDEQKNYFKIGNTSEELLKGFRYLVSSENDNNVHSLLLLNSDQISFNYKQGQFDEYEKNVSLIIFFVNSSSGNYIFNGNYSDKNKTLNGEVALNQNFGAEDSVILKFISCELELNEWEDEYEISFSGTLENNETIKGNFKGEIEKLPDLDEW
jgi:hypothetical protein